MKNRQNRRTIGAVALLSVAIPVLAGGCTFLKQTREDVQPVAVRSMRESQTLNPDASKNRKVVAGLDGRAASGVAAAYTKSFEERQTAKESFQGTEAD